MIALVSELIGDLASRWRRARLASLRAIDPQAPDGISDDERLERALAVDAEGAQRAVFDNSLRLGGSFARFAGRELGLDELPELLGSFPVRCLAGAWRASPDEPGAYLERSGCPSAAAGACDWWREAISGLVLGVTGGILHARHESRGHGDARCVDVVFLRARAPLRFGPIPEPMRPALERVRRLARAFDALAEVAFVGLSEGTLFYELTEPAVAGGIGVRSLVERELHRRLPALAVREITPRAVAM
jgi:hypothetical protein